MRSSKKTIKTDTRKRKEILRKVEEHFAPVLDTVLDERVFVFKTDSPDIIPGARTTAMLPLSGFIELFGDLVDLGDYNIQSYRQRNEDEDLGIDDILFDYWRKAGCLQG